MSYHRAKRPKKIPVGASVAFELGGSTVVGVVIEDRGPLGPGGLRLLRVRVAIDEFDPFEAEVLEDRLSIVYDAAV